MTDQLDPPDDGLYRPTRDELRGFAAERRDDDERERRRRDGTLHRDRLTGDGGL
jgi:hypothetical protein